MRAKNVITAAVLLMLLVTATRAQQRRWYELYDEAVRHVSRSEWTLAEGKLKEAQREGPAPGRSVLRYGMLRDAYFPDFYLGVVYMNTGRPSEALQKFELARKQNLDVRDREFLPIADYESRAQRDIRAAGPAGGAGVVPPGGGGAPAGGSVVPAGGGAKPAEPVPPTAEPLPNPAPIPANPLETAKLGTTGPVYKPPGAEGGSSKSAEATIESAKVRGQAEALTESNAMRQFFNGDYASAIATLAPLSTPRALFYRSCSRVGMALLSGESDPTVLALARQEYTKAISATVVFKSDERYISPRILQTLKARE